MSPEQARGKSIDRRTDLWAFGCVLYECLTGERAFGGRSFTDVLATIASGGFGCILGALIGGYLGGRMRDGFLGALGGTVMCMLVWPIVLLDRDRWGLLTALSIGGSLCMLGTGMVYRLLARRRKE